MDRRALGPILSAVLALVAMSPAHAQDAFEQGTKNFKAKKYALAAQAFKKAVAENSSNPTPYYYYALSLHYAKDMKAAKQEYGRIISYFPLSDAARYARQALAQLDPAYLKQIDPNYNPAAAAQQAAQQAAQPAAQPVRPTAGRAATGGAVGSGATQAQTQEDDSNDKPEVIVPSKYDSLPDSCHINYTNLANSIILESSFNNRKHPIVFDTGASNTVLGKNHLAAMGIAPPAGPADDEMVGAGGSQKAWHMKLDVRVGGIERKNFPVVVQENMLSNPLLGLNFFQGYNYTIDSGAHSLDFSKKRAGVGSVYGASTRDPSVVPFKRERRHIIVTVDVNGRKTDMLFDTGAEGTSFTNKQLKDLGISVPPDAVDAVWAGIGGTTKEKHFPLRSIKLGPIEKRDLEIAAVENSEVPWPILGQNFFGNWQYTFDDQASVIRFVRR